ncbi:hypothetical protein GYA27_02990 [candidate division WWE3 bacterium]|uniref:5'-3' exonuclease domain-containing protein n=1 Tax=candidate division WWE3 bacterium TaxID=2053526 RepID=A0A7X9DKJ0_UNCKA|nr:hypothetical protein [candidate division WWE3 bacterium]
MEKIILIDTFNFLHRAYHALPNTFRSPDGEPTNAVYGVTSMLINLFSEVKPNYVVAALDMQEATFRIEDFTGYKAQRKPMEEDLSSQIPKVIEIMEAFGIKIVGVNGYEADDVIATVAKTYEHNYEIVIVSNDRDLWQLASDTVSIMLPNTKGAVEWLGPKEVLARFGFPPSKIADYKGLRGDPSDNIPGVYGIGEKTATDLIKKYGSLEEIYKNVEKIEQHSLKEKLINSYEQAVMSKKLACLIMDVPFQLDIKDARYKTLNKLQVKEVLEKYNFKSLIRRLGFDDDSSLKRNAKTNEVNKDQLALF